MALPAGGTGPSPAPATANDALAVPASVTLVGDLQSELGCDGDWDPTCSATHFDYSANSDVWRRAFDVPAGNWQYKVALDGGWDENYGAGAERDGPNIGLHLSDAANIRFYYDHKSHWVTDSVNSRIVTAAGSFQRELGCSDDWAPDCLRSWLQDIDGDGTYTMSTTAIPTGSYEAKATIDESWTEHYGAGGASPGDNIPFSVPADGSTVLFSFVSSTNVLTITITPPTGRQNNDVEWDGLRHDSRDLLYRTPGGAVPAGTPVKIRFRTFHDDVTSVKLRVWSLNAGAQQIIDMERAATDVSCYEAALAHDSCDFWQATLANAVPDNLWYRFIVSDGTDTDYYADDTPALDGGLGAPSDDPVDNSYALMVYEPGFSAPSWARNAVIYQVFPDRFFNGDPRNDPQAGDPRYDEPVIKLPWGTLPEGYCRHYADAATNCPWRFLGEEDPPSWSPTIEGPRGRDYMGGDLAGLRAKLGHLRSIGVTAIYLNPIFDSGSNHGYDTQDYTRIDPYFGTQKDFDDLVRQANRHGIRLILDGVFNHLSSDSPFFDRYGRYETLGACESVESPFRAWFIFFPQANGPCAGPEGANTMGYRSWFGFDSIPEINKSLTEVQEYFLTAPDSIARLWLQRGAQGWRMDVSGDPSFPDGYWETFRQVVKSVNPQALTISETWQKDSTLLRELRGDRFDTTMNYRIRDAVLGLLSPHSSWDSKGFADSGRQISPAEFAARMLSQREDYPAAAYYSLMNLLGGHDTERLLWALTPGPETRADREFDAANLAEGKRRLQLASLIQFTVPGAPTVYYGDEVGITGDDDPDDRRTFPWPETGGTRDDELKNHYQALAQLRRASGALTDGDFSVLLVGSASEGTVAYGRKTNSRAAIVAVNRSADSRTLAVPVAGFVPDGTSFSGGYGVGTTVAPVIAADGMVSITLPALSGVVLTTGNVNLTAPAAPANLRITGEGDATVSLAWDGVARAAGYNLYRSPLSGGGFVKVNDTLVTGTTFTDSGLANAKTYFYVVTVVSRAGIESGWSNEVTALPHLPIGWANLQWPPTLSHTISTINRTASVYGQVWIGGATDAPGPTPTLRAQAGFGPPGSAPAGNAAWTWVEASFNVDVGNNDEFVASFLPDATGVFDYVYRYSTTNGAAWLYADLDGPFTGTPPSPGVMTVNPSDDTTPPATPTGLHVVSASPAGIELAWDAVTGDPTLHGYEVGRSSASGGPYATLAMVTGTTYTDSAVVENATYHYVVRAVDTSFNRSADSAEVSATTELRMVTLNFTVTVPASTDGTGRSVHIAGTLHHLEGGLPEWDPGGVALTRGDETTWTITLTGRESTQVEYKYVLGAWEYVEKGAACEEIANRTLTLSYGGSGVQNVNDTVLNWRNVHPCGD